MREGKKGSKTSCCRVAEVVMGDSRCMGMSLQASVKGVQYCGRLRILQDDRERGAGKWGRAQDLHCIIVMARRQGRVLQPAATFLQCPW